MKFKVGQRVELIESWGKIKAGAVAKVIRSEYVSFDDTFIGIRWISGIGIKGNTNGGYWPRQFKPYNQEGEQLLFNFMY